MARIRSTQAQIRGQIVRDEQLVSRNFYVVSFICIAITVIAILVFMFWAGGRWSGGTSSISPAIVPPAPPVVIVSPLVVPPLPPPSAPAAPRALSSEERAEKYKEELRRRYGVIP